MGDPIYLNPSKIRTSQERLVTLDKEPLCKTLVSYTEWVILEI